MEKDILKNIFSKFKYSYIIYENIIYNNISFTYCYINKQVIFRNINRKPISIEINLNDETTFLYFKSFYYIIANIINIDNKIDDKKIKSIVEQENLVININMKNNKYINDFNNFIIDKININIPYN